MVGQHQEMNFKCRHVLTDLDTLVTPLAAAAYLGKLEILNIILETNRIDVNLATEESCKRYKSDVVTCL